MVPVILDGLTDDELKKEAKNESKNDAISAIIKAAKCLVSRVPNEEEMVKSLEIFRLKMILRYASYVVMLTLFCPVRVRIS
jgi:ubiquitin carboxyl-terminal hydrolase 9/24